MRNVWRAAAALFFLFAPVAARADERILSFSSDIQIQKDSALEVAETIDVHAENQQINHGIYRDFPTRYQGRTGTQFHIGFTFEGATLDGAPVRASVEPTGNGVRVRLGNPNSFDAPGDHEYVIRYRATREIGRISNFDELYWNVTGNGWVFPIDQAQVRIRLPQPIAFGQRSAYTGPAGSTASLAKVADEAPGDITFQTTEGLAPYEGLTVAVAFPKGVVGQPSSGSRLLDALADYGPPLLGLLSLIGTCIFYYFAWARAGRDPRAGTIVPMYTPPDDLTPAGMRYIMEMTADDRTFAAALVDMGVRGQVKIVEEDRGWLSGTTMRVERLSNEAPLPGDEQAALDALCPPGESVLMVKASRSQFVAAKGALNAILKARYDGKLFKRNAGWAIAGLLLFSAMFWLTCAAVVVSTYGQLTWQIVVVIGSLLVSALLWLAFHQVPMGKHVLSLITVVAYWVGFNLGKPVLEAAFDSGWRLPLVLALLGAPIVVSAFWWIGSPTPDGRKILDHIAGFKQYLSITEAERLDRMTPPKETPELFEKYLPFAIALGVENHWANHFSGILAAASAQSPRGFIWYSGSSSPWSDPTGFVSSVGSSLSSAVGEASSASGSGGGGMSGGGGGGGGGGGW